MRKSCGNFYCLRRRRRQRTSSDSHVRTGRPHGSPCDKHSVCIHRRKRHVQHDCADLLGLDAATFTSVLATDVLSASLTGPTTFYDGTNVLTGRKLDDDVITVELILIFGGPDAMSNPGLTDDNVSQNDKSFSDSFPYLASPH
jgi:hypothetical protein